MIRIQLVKKARGRIYKSEDIIRAITGRGLSHDESGAPFFPDDDESFVSVTDTKNYWACAISDHQIGIDMEEADRQVKPAVAKRFSAPEQEYLAALSEGGREWREEFFSIWTRKEAWSKYKGKGISIGFSRFSVLNGIIEGVPLASLIKGDLVFGIAGDNEAEIVRFEYDAPMEKTALDYAAGLLDARAYSQAELSRKLSDRGYGEEEISEAMEKLREYGYVNDEAYASALARRGAEGGKGSARIAMDLRDKGIEKDLARETASEYKEGEYERALGIARKLLGGGTDGEAEGSGPTDDPDELSAEHKKELYAKRQKLVGKVTRKLSALGYEASVIWSVVEDLNI